MNTDNQQHESGERGNRLRNGGLLLTAAGLGAILWLILALSGVGPGPHGAFVLVLLCLVGIVLTGAGFTLMVFGADPFAEVPGAPTPSSEPDRSDQVTLRIPGESTIDSVSG